jgi:predicted ATPase with chaperone activity
MGLSERSKTGVLRVAHTIAGLEVAERIDKAHLAEALQYRLEGRTALRIVLKRLT